MAGPTQVAGDIYSLESESFDHLYMGAMWAIAHNYRGVLEKIDSLKVEGRVPTFLYFCASWKLFGLAAKIVKVVVLWGTSAKMN